MDRELLIDEVMMVLPALMRGMVRPSSVELGRRKKLANAHVSPGHEHRHAHVSPGHIQIMIALVRGPQSIGRLAEIVGVSPPAATQLVDRLAEHGIVERRHDPKDRRIVLVDYTPGERELAQRIMENRRKPLRRVVDNLTDDEARAFLKGLQLLADSFRAGHGET